MTILLFPITPASVTNNCNDMINSPLITTTTIITIAIKISDIVNHSIN